jgi:AcrR family transcriptional regulator
LSIDFWLLIGYNKNNSYGSNINPRRNEITTILPGRWLRAPLQARSHETLERLLEAGEVLLGERGYEGTRVHDVAELADATVGAFYLRFRDKQSFFQVLQQRFIDRTRGIADAELAPELWRDRSALELLSRLVETVVAIFREHGKLLRAFMHRRVMEPSPTDPMRDLGVEIAERLTAILAEKQAEIEHTDLEAAVGFGLQVVYSTLANAVVLDPSGPGSIADDRVAPELTRMLAGYLGMAAGRDPREGDVQGARHEEDSTPGEGE